MGSMKTAGVRIADNLADPTSALSLGGRLLLVGVVSTAVLLVITVAPTPVGFALTAGVAAAWCAWLETALIPERVMVCMSSNALAPRVIRTGARIAGRLGSRWYAVYVETPSERHDRIKPGDAEALQQNVTLAETLGATVVRVKAGKPADGLIAFAQREGVTHVILGQSARTRWELLVRGSTLDKFLSAVPDAAVHVVPLTEN